MNEAASHNAVWKGLYMGLFPQQNPNLKIKSWFKFYKRRVVAASKTNSSPFGGSPMIIGTFHYSQWEKINIISLRFFG
jgi:hypothetical protein